MTIIKQYHTSILILIWKWFFCSVNWSSLNVWISLDPDVANIIYKLYIFCIILKLGELKSRSRFFSQGLVPVQGSSHLPCKCPVLHSFFLSSVWKAGALTSCFFLKLHEIQCCVTASTDSTFHTENNRSRMVGLASARAHVCHCYQFKDTVQNHNVVWSVLWNNVCHSLIILFWP